MTRPPQSLYVALFFGLHDPTYRGVRQTLGAQCAITVPRQTYRRLGLLADADFQRVRALEIQLVEAIRKRKE